MFAPSIKSPKIIKTSISTLLLASVLFVPASLAQSPYVQTYGKQNNTQRADKAAKQIQNSAKTTATANATKSKVKMIVPPTQHISAGPKWQQFADYINLKPGQENLPLKFTVLNGSGGTPPLRAIRANLSGRRLFTEKDFQGKRKLSIDLSNALTAGSTQIVFQSYGAAGSAFKWQITSSVSPVVTSLKPDKAAKEADITVTGKSLPTDKRAYIVKVDGVIANVSDATVENFKFKVPKRVKAGKDKKVEITIAGAKMKTLKLTIQDQPEITYLSHVSIAGSQLLTIKGKNFSKDPKDIEVTFNGAKGNVTASSDDSISVVTPEIEAMPAPVTIQVKVGDLNCKKAGMILFSQRNIPNNGTYSPFQVARHLL